MERAGRRSGIARFARDSPLEQSGFEPLVPPPSRTLAVVTCLRTKIEHFRAPLPEILADRLEMTSGNLT
jgi:hypothetical protein